MNATLAPSSPFSGMPQTSVKPLWAAVGVLSVCVLAMGATLVHINNRPEPLAQSALPFASVQAMDAAAALSTPAGMITEEKNIEKPLLPGIKSAQNAPKIIAKTNPSTATKTPVALPSSPAPVPQVATGYPPVVASAPVVVAQAPAKPVCASCGTVEAVTPITREGAGSGAGVIAGGVLGGVVGNQVGKGNGRKAATVLGAIGGGWAGNAIEKNMKKTTAYNVRIRMEDGSSRTVEQSTAPSVGSKVTLDGNSMRPA